MRTLALTAAGPLSLLIAGCAGTPTPGATAPAATAPPAAVETPAATAPAESIIGTTWEWVETVTPVETVQAADPTRYTLRIDDGRAAVRADCNRASGAVEVGADGAIAFKPMAMTRAMCPPGSQSDRYVRDLGFAAHHFFRDGALYIDLRADAGTLRFRRAATR